MLVVAAYQQIAARGLEGLRLREVSAAAGIDHSTLHHYFATKQDLVKAVVSYATRQFWTADKPEGTPAELLSFQLARLAGMIEDRPELHRVVRELDLRALRDPEVATVISAWEQGWRTSLAEMFSAGLTDGSWAEGVDAAAAVELVIAAVKGGSLVPDRARTALGQLERLLVAAPGPDGRGRSQSRPAKALRS
jgi:AcrR family transcriptional regulator